MPHPKTHANAIPANTNPDDHQSALGNNIAHTPGPWVAIPSMSRDFDASRPIFEDGLWNILRDYDRNLLPIATIDKADDHDDATREKAAFDARLIAAAPELLTAAKTASALIQSELQLLLDSYCPRPAAGVHDESLLDVGTAHDIATMRHTVALLNLAVAKAEGK